MREEGKSLKGARGKTSSVGEIESNSYLRPSLCQDLASRISLQGKGISEKKREPEGGERNSSLGECGGSYGE